ncbi:hypothetical protein COLO4_21643 [Corchorus olitorius]|uniref:F-box associated beta-propeller type 1 domain-containing protein n=1 Tax=Corchorus olitorius TaxID=93759 RepID=A0A1R3IS55_9ROSI|nr:hypothetical protein COLO4_21643 [Corchorus olitorius]
MDSDGSNREVVLIQDYDYDDKDFIYNSHCFCCILGSCNGLLLVSTSVRYNCQLVLWNPSTGKCKRIPDVHLSDEAFIISGLAYVSSSRNYKALIVYHQISGCPSPNHEYGNYEALGCNIYDYNLNCWTRKNYDAFPYRLLHTSSSAIMVNGVPHWVVYRRRVDPSKPARNRNVLPCLVSYLIVYFDFETEKFKEVGLPEWAAEEVKFDIGVLGGCLCMCLDPQKGSESIEVWTMKEYGIAESWTKSFVISSPSFQSLTPLCLMGKNQVLMKVVEKKKDEQKLTKEPRRQRLRSVIRN